MSNVATSYDELPYESRPFTEAHPDRLAVVATLFGMRPPPIENCRVLELGCANGSNLVPMAAVLSGSRFVGIDLSRRQIDDARRAVAAVGLTNIELEARSITDLGPELGSFDYIICHGVYSWVPTEVRDKILDICAHQLTPRGVAYISYNTLPGWTLHRMIREALLYHTRRLVTPLDKVRHARQFLDFLARSGGDDPRSNYNVALQKSAETLRPRSDSYLFHEYLEEVNDPFYLHEFVEHAAEHGLQYLGDAHVASMLLGQLPREVEDTVRTLARDLVESEQYLDLIQNRPFRRTLLCHQGITLDHSLRPAALATLAVSTSARPLSPSVDVRSSAFEEFRLPGGRTLSTQEPLVKAALHHLADAAPRRVPFETLLPAARARLERESASLDADRELLGARVLSYYTTGFVSLHRHVPCLASEPGDRPRASPVVRLQALTGLRVTNLWHEQIEVTEFARRLAAFLDGAHDRAALLETMTALVRDGALALAPPPIDTAAPEELRARVRAVLDETLYLFAKSACLTA
jgi:methyltransferase-like protein/2-polyprenyl-3-methyl-5-hydroxy-6-metoxy-1,4-benzoquinol methylase